MEGCEERPEEDYKIIGFNIPFRSLYTKKKILCFFFKGELRYGDKTKTRKKKKFEIQNKQNYKRASLVKTRTKLYEDGQIINWT